MAGDGREGATYWVMLKLVAPQRPAWAPEAICPKEAPWDQVILDVWRSKDDRNDDSTGTTAKCGAGGSQPDFADETGSSPHAAAVRLRRILRDDR